MGLYMIIVLGIDPGNSTGIAVIEIDDDKKPKLREAWVSLDQTAIEYRNLIEEADYIIVEDFKVRPAKARSGSFDWSNMITPKIIGSIQTLAILAGKQVVLQQPTVKPLGYGFAQMKYVKGKPGTHTADAAAHALFYAVRHNLCSPSKLL